MRMIALMLIAAAAPVAHAIDYEVATPESVAADCKPTIEKGGNYSQCFVGSAKLVAVMCGAAARTSSAEALKCSGWAEGMLKTTYDLALPVVQSTPTATQALKEIYVYTVATVRSYPSSAYNSRLEFQRMEDARRIGIEERIARLQLELPAAVPPPPTPEQIARRQKSTDCAVEALHRGLPAAEYPAFVKACAER